nr:unnamed protein product [Spirometra erinaceieuropaei]
MFRQSLMDLAIETIKLLLQSKYDETENRLGRAQVLQLLKFCLRTYFTFDGTIYEQVKGTPMGSPISGFIAEAVLQRLESLAFQHHKPTFWARYVDDTFVFIDRDQLLTFKERLNAVFPDIQFTMEEEENNQLAFLDVLVCRKDCGGLKTKVFRKATNTMQMRLRIPAGRVHSCPAIDVLSVVVVVAGHNPGQIFVVDRECGVERQGAGSAAPFTCYLPTSGLLGFFLAPGPGEEEEEEEEEESVRPLSL